MTENSGGKRKFVRVGRGLVWVAAPALLLAALVFVNARLNGGGGRWIAPTGDSAVWPSGGRLFLASVGLAAAATWVAALLGVPFGVSLGRRPRTIMAALAFVPLLVPAHLAAYLWRFTLEDVFAAFTGGAGLWRTAAGRFLGGAWTLGAMLWPLVALPTAMSMFVRGNRLEQELATLAPPRAVFWRAVMPGLLPGMLAGAGAVFLLALSNYGVPLMWDLPSQNVAVFARLAAFYEPGRALVMSLPLLGVVFVCCAAALLWALAGRHAVDIGEWTLRAPCGRGRTGTSVRVFAAITLLATVGGPLASLAASPSWFRGMRAEFVAGLDPFVNGVGLALMGAAGSVALGVGLARLLRRARRAWHVTVEMIGLCLLFMPATILCVALSTMQSGPAPLVAVYRSAGIFLVAFGLRFFYIPWKIASIVQRLQGPPHEDMMRLMGLPWFARARLAFGGVLKPAVTVSALIVFALALGELEIATFLYPPGWRPVSVFLDNLMHYGRSADVVQWSAIVVLTEAAIAWILLAAGLSQWRTLRAAA